MTPDTLIAAAHSNPVNDALLTRLPRLGLAQCHLAAGCLYQAVWNAASGKPAEHGIKDYDVFYFDDRDLSWEAEDVVIRRVDELTRDLGVTVEVRNQARVHLWYEKRFGTPSPPLRSSRHGIERFLVACTCIGINVENGDLYAPYGLDDLRRGILKMTPSVDEPALFRLKAESYRSRWPFLTIVA